MITAHSFPGGPAGARRGFSPELDRTVRMIRLLHVHAGMTDRALRAASRDAADYLARAAGEATGDPQPARLGGSGARDA